MEEMRKLKNKEAIDKNEEETEGWKKEKEEERREDKTREEMR